MTILANHPATSDISVVIPPGTIGIWPVSSPPSGWLLCAGQELNRTGTYANLFAAIAFAYGAGNGTTTFKIPDLRGSVAVGAHSMVGAEPVPARLTANKDKGQGAGQRSLSLTLSEMAAHQHAPTGYMNRNWSHAHLWNYTSLSVNGIGSSFTGLDYYSLNNSGVYSNTVDTNHIHSISSVGAYYDHNNMQPYIALNQIIKI